jgi:hypothetical protein
MKARRLPQRRNLLPPEFVLSFDILVAVSSSEIQELAVKEIAAYVT